MTVKRPHMLTEGYLKAWADARGRVDVIDVQHRRGFPSSTINATVVSYVYETSVLAHNLEDEYSRIESAGIPVIVKLREGAASLTLSQRDAMIAFLDMHLDRGRYADQTELRVPAVLVKAEGQFEDAELALADVMLLSQSHPDVLRLASLGLDHWEWKVLDARGLATGDGAVLLWRQTDDADICTVSFPLSPTRLLVIGRDLPDELPLNARVARNSKRWLVGARGALNLDWANGQ